MHDSWISGCHCHLSSNIFYRNRNGVPHKTGVLPYRPHYSSEGCSLCLTMRRFHLGKNDTVLFALLMTSMMCDLTKSTFQCTQKKVTKYNNQLGNGKKNRYFVRNLDDATYLTLVTNRDIYINMKLLQSIHVLYTTSNCLTSNWSSSVNI